MTTPSKWTHGDTVTEANLDDLSDALTEAYAILPHEARNVPALYLGQHGTANAEFASVNYRLYHTHRYLHFIGTGKIVSDVDGDEDVRIAATSGGVYDLDQVEWMAYGFVYRVQGVSAAFESPDA